MIRRLRLSPHNKLVNNSCARHWIFYLRNGFWGTVTTRRESKRSLRSSRTVSETNSQTKEELTNTYTQMREERDCAVGSHLALLLQMKRATRDREVEGMAKTQISQSRTSIKVSLQVTLACPLAGEQSMSAQAAAVPPPPLLRRCSPRSRVVHNVSGRASCSNLFLSSLPAPLS